MPQFDSRPGGVYRTANVGAIAAEEQIPEAPAASAGEPRLVDSLRTIAGEASHVVLWTLEALSLAAFVAALLMLFKAHEWQQFGALATAISFFTVSACTGGYLISIKGEAGGNQR